MEILANPQILTLGLKYASKLDKRRLVGKLMDLATKLSDEGEDLGVEVGLFLKVYVFVNFISFSGNSNTGTYNCKTGL